MVAQRTFWPGLAWGLVLLAAVGCSNDRKGHRTPRRQLSVERTFDGSYPSQAGCTTGMVADLVRRIGGERVAVTQLMGEGVDPHRYKASIGHLNQLNAADVVFYSGLHLEGKMGDIFDRMASKRQTFA